MAKGQITEDDLATGLKGIGNFSGLASPRVRRDNPFRDSRADNAPAVGPVKTVELPVAEVPTTAPMPAEASVERLQPKPKPVRKVVLERKPHEERRGEAEEKPAARKAEVYTERVTLQLSPAMRDDVNDLARDLQRSKTTKDERITANTVMRVALQLFIDHFQLKRGDVANSEEELYSLAAQKLKLR